jgi:acetylornithine deacetylase/succinyl-diaminopimelate desuccinylase-like protein
VYPVYQWASSDGLYYRAIGIPAIQNGPCNPGIHGYNETADILEILNMAKNHMAIAVD